jgi:hypothetical protein
MARKPASLTSRLAALLILASGCSAVQYVQFEAPAGVEMHVLRSSASEGGSEAAPGTWPVRAGRVYACRIRFDREALHAFGLAGTEIDVLEREDQLTLHGGLVALKGGDDGQTLVLGLDATAVRAALLQERVAVAWGRDAHGNARVLLKVSVGGVPLDDPDLAAHAAEAKGGLGEVLFCVAEIALEVLLLIPCQ